eukprot:1642601-Rhodomonas_salina.7
MYVIAGIRIRRGGELLCEIGHNHTKSRHRSNQGRAFQHLISHAFDSCAFDFARYLRQCAEAVQGARKVGGPLILHPFAPGVFLTVRFQKSARDRQRLGGLKRTDSTPGSPVYDTMSVLGIA